MDIIFFFFLIFHRHSDPNINMIFLWYTLLLLLLIIISRIMVMCAPIYNTTRHKFVLKFKKTVQDRFSSSAFYIDIKLYYLKKIKEVKDRFENSQFTSKSHRRTNIFFFFFTNKYFKIFFRRISIVRDAIQSIRAHINIVLKQYFLA